MTLKLLLFFFLGVKDVICACPDVNFGMDTGVGFIFFVYENGSLVSTTEDQTDRIPKAEVESELFNICCT